MSDGWMDGWIVDATVLDETIVACLSINKFGSLLF